MNIILLYVSIVLQFTAALAAVAIVFKTGRIRGWILLASGLVFMFLRRLISLYNAYEAGNTIVYPAAEIIAMITSFLLLLGVFLLSDSFRGFQRTGQRLKKELEEKERTRLELEEREREYRTLVNNLPGFAYRCANDRNWTMKFVSDGCSEITGYSPEDLVENRTISYNDIIEPEYKERIWNKWQRILSEKGVFQYEYPIVTRQKNRRWVSEKGCGVFSEEGELLSLEGFITDVTERRKAEEELQTVEKLSSLGILAGGIAHDFNNIMTGIFGNISMALEHIHSDHSAGEYLRQADGSMKRAMRLTHQLLTFARGGEPVLENVNLEELIEETVRFDLSGSNVTPVFRWEKGLRQAEADRSQLQQVISNLTLNSDQAMPDGGRLEVSASNYSSYTVEFLEMNPGDYVKIVFKDHGKGISRESMEKIFDPYFTTKSGGTGLGLTTVYSVVKRHGGRVTVASEEGRGTEFTLYLPAVQFQGESGNNTAGDFRIPCSDEVRRILVMDDEAVVRNVARKMLEHLGYQVETVSDGREAVQRYVEASEAHRSFDLLIIDLTIPGGMGGEEAMREILEYDPKATAFVSSGYSESPVMSNCASCGFSGVIAKPYSLKTLRNTLEQLWGNC